MTTISENLTKDDLIKFAENRIMKKFEGIKIAAVEVKEERGCFGFFDGVSVEFELEDENE